MTLSKGQQSELRDLVDALCEDMLTREQAAQLEALVCTDDEACRYYLNYLNLHGLLLLENTNGEPLDARWMVRQATQAVPAPPPPGRSPLLGFLISSFQPGLDYVSHRMPLLTVAAAVAMGSLVTILVAWVVVPYWRGAPTPAPDRVLVQAPVQAPVQPPVPVPAPVQPPVLEHVARLMRTVGCKWADGAAPTPGAFLAREQRLELVEGLAEIVFHSGARVVLQGPSTFELESGNAGRLDVGRLVGKVCPDVVGFTIQTPVARIVDLGTEFGVAVEKDHFTEVHVFSGMVDVGLRAQAGVGPMRLAKGQAVRLDTAGSATSLVAADVQNFVRVMPPFGRRLLQGRVPLCDDFNNNSIDTDMWQTETFGTADVQATGQKMQFTNRGYLCTKAEFDPNDYPGGIAVEGTWTVGNVTDNHSGFMLATRSDGMPMGARRLPRNGIMCMVFDSLDAIFIYECNNYIGSSGIGLTELVVNESLGFAIGAGDTVNIKLVDTGSSVTFTVTKGANSKTATVTSNLDSNVNHVLFCNQLRTQVVAATSDLDDVTIAAAAVSEQKTTLKKED